MPLAANSAAIVHNIQLDEQDNFGTWGINTDTYSTPVFYIERDTPVQRWTFSDCLNVPQLAPVIADSLAAVPTRPTTATGLPLGAFRIRISELQRGYSDHAINLVTVRTPAAGAATQLRPAGPECTAKTPARLGPPQSLR